MGGLVVVPAVLGENAELVIEGGGEIPETEFQVDVKGLLVYGPSLVEPPLLLGEAAKRAIGLGHGLPVIEVQVYAEGVLVGLFGLVEPAPAAGRGCRDGNRGPRRRAGHQIEGRCRWPAGRRPRSRRAAPARER